MKSCNDITFLDSYWNEAKNIAQRIVTELPQLREPDIKSATGKLMYIVNFSDLGKSWSVKDILSKHLGQSPTLKILADKISHMIYKGNADSVKPMIEAIVSGKIRHFSKGLSKAEIKSNEFKNHLDIRVRMISTNRTKEPIGFGHFRWDHKAHTLTQDELNHVKNYFKL